MKLYMTPGSCSTGIHILLEELDLAFEAYIVNLLAGDHRKPDYLALNPKSTIPVLVRNDGSAITEFQAIAYWLARSYPKARLLPDDIDAATRVMEVMDYVVGTIHTQGFARIFTTDVFTPNKTDEETIRAQGNDIVTRAFGIIDRQLASDCYVVGNFSIADSALFYVEFWAVKTGMPLPPKCRGHYQLMLGRPAVRRVLREEGYRQYP